MMSKQRISVLWCILISLLAGGESITVPGTAIVAIVPVEWTVLPLDGPVAIIQGPGRNSGSLPRLTLATASGDPTTTSTALRTSLLRVADGCQILDDDELPIGGRVWRRLRVRFAIGPVPFGQSAWVGSVSGKTVVAVLSAPEDILATQLATATTVVASLRSAP